MRMPCRVRFVWDAFLWKRHHPDYLKTRVMVTLFGGYFGSRLMSNIREEKDIPMVFLQVSFCPGPEMLVINTETANEFVEPLIGGLP